MPLIGEASLETRLLLGAVAGLVFGWAAWRARFLTGSGAACGGGLAACIVALGGGAWIAPSVAFFVLSSVLSRAGRLRAGTAGQESAEGHVRDAGQVLANGGVAWALLLAHAATAPEAAVWYAGFVGAFAAAAADTWATELGAFSRRRPRHVFTGRAVPRGTSGAVSAVGTLAAGAGALSVAGAAVLVRPGALGVEMGLLVAAAGVAGALADSLLGATVQARYRDAQTGRPTERPRAADGTPNALTHGVRWMTDDAVNAACTAVGAALAMLCV